MIFFQLVFLYLKGDAKMKQRSVIITQHAKLSYSANSMVVQTMMDINYVPIDDIYLIIVQTTRAVLTTELINQISQHQIKLVFTDSSGQPICETVNYYSNNQTVSTLTSQVNWDTGQKETLWTQLVKTKIQNQITNLKTHDLEYKDLNKQLDAVKSNDSTNREAVVARSYFVRLFGETFVRKQETPINAALNYGYSIILAEINRNIVANGYTPTIGIHHHREDNHFNFGSDLIEPFRPIIDDWISNQKFYEFTSDIKFGLVRLLSAEVRYRGRSMYLNNAVTQYVMDCVKFLNGKKEMTTIELELIGYEV